MVHLPPDTKLIVQTTIGIEILITTAIADLVITDRPGRQEVLDTIQTWDRRLAVDYVDALPFVQWGWPVVPQLGCTIDAEVFPEPVVRTRRSGSRCGRRVLSEKPPNNRREGATQGGVSIRGDIENRGVASIDGVEGGEEVPS